MEEQLREGVGVTTRRALVAGAAALAAHLATSGAEARDLDNTLIIELATGKVTVELRPDLAPLHVARIKELAGEGFYDGIVFHRVIPGFMAQTGDPTGTGRGGSDKPNLKAEFTKTPFERGTLGMARSQNPNSANSQFFICFDRSDWLDGQYTVFGKVVDGMDLVDRIAKGEPPSNPDKMVRVYVASAAPAAN
jgi:cyclophilin family peptidyl-prolyl cis-trans isomerase